MICLNLLSPIKKQELASRNTYLFAETTISVLLIFTIAVSIILLIAKVILQNNLDDMAEQTTLILKEYGGYNQEIKAVNRTIQTISDIQKNHAYWSDFLGQFYGLLPEGIQLTSLKINKTEQTLNLLGKAKSRDILLTLKVNLEKSPLLSEVKYPLSSLLTQDNIDFEFNLKLNPAASGK